MRHNALALLLITRPWIRSFKHKSRHLAMLKRSTSTHEGSVSPPPTRRKIESTTTNKAVASFFKPASQREPENIVWRTINQSLIVGKYNPPNNSATALSSPAKVAAFDFDDTIISPINQGNRWVRSGSSWEWWNACVPGRLKELHAQGFLVVLLSNQGGVSLKEDSKKVQKDKASLTNIKAQVSSVLRQLDFPVSFYAATTQDTYRKPRTGMWEMMRKDHGLDKDDTLDLDQSFYVGDAAGRIQIDERKTDFASSDRELASNIGIKFETPEQFFLGAAAEPFTHKFQPSQFLLDSANTVQSEPNFSKQSPQELVVFCGSPGAGKSSFFWKILQPLGFERVNQDILRTRDRCLKVGREYLDQGKSVAVDNTNRNIETRAYWVRLGNEFRVPIRCVHFTASPRLCEHNAAVRANNKLMNPENRESLPPIAFVDFARRFEEPQKEEGFQDITKVNFAFVGSDEARQLWSKFWVSKYST